MTISNTTGAFVIISGSNKYATKGTVVLYVENDVTYYLTFDSQNVAFKPSEVTTINGAPVTDCFAQLIAILP